MFNSPYNYNPQASIDRINSQIAELENMKNKISTNPIPQSTNLTQNFQIAPNNQVGIKYANSIDEVKREIVSVETPFFSNDFSVVWLKNITGDIKSYELKEIVEKDEKDILIDSLQMQINQLKEVIQNATTINSNVDESIESEKSSSVSRSKSSNAKSK